MYQIISYIKFLLKATNQHGVHSPFVYNLVTTCFYDKTHYKEYTNLKSYRRFLLSNSQQLSITDFGAGSKVFKSNTRLVKDIAKTSGTSLKRAKLLYRLVQYFKPKQVLELGTSLGIATQAMALGNPEATIVSIEGCPEVSSFTSKNLNQQALKHISIKTGRFDDVLPKLDTSTWDLVFFDGHHNKTATLAYFEQLLPKTHNNTLFILDDIHWSKDMNNAWKAIKTHPKVTVSIDTFFWGLVLFRKEQVKEHFIIRL